jgi:hypothetical protein
MHPSVQHAQAPFIRIGVVDKADHAVSQVSSITLALFNHSLPCACYQTIIPCLALAIKQSFLAFRLLPNNHSLPCACY